MKVLQVDIIQRRISRMILILLILLVCIVANAQIVNVSTAVQLQNALTNALPGQIIVIADGSYNSSSGNFTVPAGVNGTAQQPITLQGSRKAILTTADSAHGYGLWLKGSKYWVLKGFTTRYCKNGVMIDSSQYITVDSVQAKKCGQSGIALRKWTSYCTVQHCFTDSLGLLIPGEGEGIYIGSANSNWSVNTGGTPDTCNYNQILYNTFGSAITAENIDIKEGTTGGLVRGNVFNGRGLSNQNGGDSWVDVKGNHWTIEDNTGTDTYLDGFQTHITYAGWGNYNTFRNNHLTVNAAGYGIRIATSSAAGTANGNVVCSNNTATTAGAGLANITISTCTLGMTESVKEVFLLRQTGSAFTIKNTSLADADLVATDLQGRRVASFILHPGLNSILFADLVPGIYSLTLYSASTGARRAFKVCIP